MCSLFSRSLRGRLLCCTQKWLRLHNPLFMFSDFGVNQTHSKKENITKTLNQSIDDDDKSIQHI